jgi:16S rRNA (adenine1518-N6/adenine1519-N6)-dimethyltransferase
MTDLSRDYLIGQLKQNDIWLKKSYGQHFLVDPKYLETMISAANIHSGITIVEVGPGLGALTKELSQANSEGLILAIEADWKLADILRNEVGQKKNVKIVHSNALTYNWEAIEAPYQVVANLPYNIASPLLYSWLINTKNPPTKITVMVQKEVAARLTAKVATRDRGLPTIMVELAGEAQLICEIPPTAFFPPPKVDSAIIDIELKPKIGDELAILKIAKAGFSNKRRTLENSLSGSLNLSKEKTREFLNQSEIPPFARAEELTLEQWRVLAKNIYQSYNR